MELGVIDVPTDSIVGTKSVGRRSAFAANFMPLLPNSTEFAAKWMALCDANLSDEGIHDPIRCYGYLGRFYVHGNHDQSYNSFPPEGCDCAEDRILCFNGLRILGLGGCPVYSNGAHQYTERQMMRRISRLRPALRRAGGVDILLTHAPASGWGDAGDYAHRGFDCFNDLMDKYAPAYHVHGHVHMNYGRDISRTLRRGAATVINAWNKYLLEI